MAAYVTNEEFQQAIGAQTLLDIASTNGVLDSARVTQALTEASAFADGYLHAYLPLSLVQTQAAKRAIIQVANEYVRLPEQSTEDSRRGFDRAVAWLKDIACNKAQLPGGVPAEQVDADDPVVAALPRVWSRDNVRGLL